MEGVWHFNFYSLHFRFHEYLIRVVVFIDSSFTVHETDVGDMVPCATMVRGAITRLCSWRLASTVA